MLDFGKKITSSSLVSVIIDTYYRPKMLENAVFHILNQTYSNLELIIVNNGATKETLKYINSVKKKDSRIKIVDFHENQFSWNDPQMLIRICLNAGLDACKGDLVFYQADDDWIALDFIQRMVNLFVNNHKCITAIGRVANAKPDGTIINYYPVVERDKYVEGLDLATDFITNKNYINQENPGHSFVIKRDILNKYGRFQDTFEKQQLYGIVPFGISGFDPEAIMYWGRHDIQLNSIGTKRLIFWEKYMLKNIKSKRNSFIEIWKINFGIEHSKLMKNHCQAVVLKGFYQMIFSHIFFLKFRDLFLFINKYYNQVSYMKKHHIYFIYGFIQAFKRTRLIYILNLIKLFLVNFFSSPISTIRRTKYFLKSKF